MKKFIISTFAISLAIAATIAYSTNNRNDLNNLTPLEIANIEAISRAENPNNAAGYYLTACYANKSYPDAITGRTCKLRNWYDQCSYSMAWGDCSDQNNEN